MWTGSPSTRSIEIGPSAQCCIVSGWAFSIQWSILSGVEIEIISVERVTVRTVAAGILANTLPDALMRSTGPEVVKVAPSPLKM